MLPPWCFTVGIVALKLMSSVVISSVGFLLRKEILISGDQRTNFHTCFPSLQHACLLFYCCRCFFFALDFFFFEWRPSLIIEICLNIETNYLNLYIIFFHRYIDQGRNPQLYTKECLERALAKNEQVKGKIDTLTVRQHLNRIFLTIFLFTFTEYCSSNLRPGIMYTDWALVYSLKLDVFLYRSSKVSSSLNWERFFLKKCPNIRRFTETTLLHRHWKSSQIVHMSIFTYFLQLRASITLLHFYSFFNIYISICISSRWCVSVMEKHFLV